MTYQDAADQAHVSVRTIRRWAKERRFKTKRLGHRTVRIVPSSWLEFMRKPT